MPNKHNLSIEFRSNKATTKTKTEMRLRISQNGRGNLSYSHPCLTSAVAKAFKPFVAILLKDYLRLTTPYQINAYVSGLVFRQIYIDDDSNRTMIAIARHTGVSEFAEVLTPADWSIVLLPDQMPVESALMAVKLILRSLQTFLYQLHDYTT